MTVMGRDEKDHPETRGKEHFLEDELHHMLLRGNRGGKKMLS